MVINLMGFGHKIYFLTEKSSSLFAIKNSMFELKNKEGGKLVIFSFLPIHEGIGKFRNVSG